ncbi:MAG: hypothetical protein ACOZAJ_03980 [Patescibacteria group bacterium]
MLIKSLFSLLGLILSLTAYYFNWPLFNLIGGLIYLSGTAWLWGNRLKNGSPLNKTIIGLLAILAFISLSGALAFYLNLFSPILGLILFSLVPWLGQTNKIDLSKIAKERPTNFYLALGYLIVLLITWLLLWQFRTDVAWRSPWLVIPAWWWLIYLSLSVLVVYVSQKLSSLWLIPFYWLSLSILPVIFPLGYAFDPFIHQASAKLLQLTQTISPKPFYYIGQYSLEVLLSNFLKINLNRLDLWLIPFLAGLSWPVLIDSLKNKLKLSASYLPLLPIILTLPLFIITTPLALTYLWSLITIGLLCSDYHYKNQLAYLLALTSLATHPIVGLPLLGLVIWHHLSNRSKLIKILSATWLTLAVPAAFWFLNLLKPNLLNIKLNNPLPALKDLFYLIWHNLPQLPYALHLQDIIYLWGLPLSLIFLVLAAIGWLISRKQHLATANFIWPACYLTLSFLITKLFFHFDGLPNNEQNFYNLRLWHLSLLTLWPLVIVGANQVIQFLNKKTITNSSLILSLALLTAAGCYLTYPRFDLYQKDTAYPTTPGDINAVRLINNLAANKPYAVLSNQAVAAAALQEFGFSRYYNEYYFYPLPTGTNPLYQVYLQASQYNKPDRATIKQAANLTGLTNIYLILNRYWADFDKLNEVATAEANQTWLINNGSIAIYYYDFN